MHGAPDRGGTDQASIACQSGSDRAPGRAGGLAGFRWKLQLAALANASPPLPQGSGGEAIPAKTPAIG